MIKFKRGWGWGWGCEVDWNDYWQKIIKHQNSDLNPSISCVLQKVKILGEMSISHASNFPLVFPFSRPEISKDFFLCLLCKAHDWIPNFTMISNMWVFVLQYFILVRNLLMFLIETIKKAMSIGILPCILWSIVRLVLYRERSSSGNMWFFSNFHNGNKIRLNSK